MSSLLRLEWLEGHHFLVRERLSQAINNHTNEKPMLKGTNECFVFNHQGCSGLQELLLVCSGGSYRMMEIKPGSARAKQMPFLLYSLSRRWWHPCFIYRDFLCFGDTCGAGLQVSHSVKMSVLRTGGDSI